MGWRPRLLCCLFLSLSLAAAAHAATVRQEWEISYQFKSLDCVRKLAVTINGQTPGRPDAEPFRYDGEHDVLFSNWWRKITYEQATGLASVLLVWFEEPQSLLINCCGRFVSCSVMAAGACNATVPECAAPVFPVVPDGEPFRYDGEHDVLFSIWWRKITYEQATGLASVLLVWVGEPQSLLINCYGTFVSCSVMAAGACYATVPECAAPVFPVVPDEEPFGYDGEHDVLLNDWWRKITYEQATGLASVLLVWVGEPQPQSLLINCCGTFVSCSVMAAGACNATVPECAAPVFPVVPDAEPFRYDGEHDVLLNDWWRKITYEQATGLASVLLVWVGEPQSLLINCCGTFVSCSVMAGGACNATVPEYAAPVFPVVPGKTYRFRIASVTSLSALIFEIEDRNARLIGYPAPAVPSGSTSSRRPPMDYQQYGAALVAVMLCLFLGEFFVALYLAAGHPVADQSPAANESTIARSGPAGSASGSLPVGGGHTPSPSPASASSPSSTDPAYSNRSSATSSKSGEETVPTEEDPGGPPGSPPQRPVVPSAVPLADNVEGPLLTFVLALLAYDAAVAVGILTEFERIVGTWSTAAEVVYGVLTVVAIALLAVGLMAAGWHASPMAGGNSNKLSVSAFCAKLGAILFTSLLVVAFSCELGRWARVAAVPSAAVVACIMAAVWIWGDEHAVANAVVSTCWGRLLGQRREREPAAAGDDMV